MPAAAKKATTKKTTGAAAKKTAAAKAGTVKKAATASPANPASSVKPRKSAASAKPAKPAAGVKPRKSAASATTTTEPVALRCERAVAALKARASEAMRTGMTRYAIPNAKAFGVAMRDVQAVAKLCGRDHELALALWDTDLYDARMLACYVADPAQVTPAQMDRWMAQSDNWAHCDTACFALFDRSPHAWKKVAPWAKRREEFVRRAAFALLASLSVHDRSAADAAFLDGLALIEQGASDERNFVKKAVNWALRSIGKRNAVLHAAALATAQRLAASEAAAPRWVGKDALRELRSDSVTARIAKKSTAEKNKKLSRKT